MDNTEDLRARADILQIGLSTGFAVATAIGIPLIALATENYILAGASPDLKETWQGVSFPASVVVASPLLLSLPLVESAARKLANRYYFGPR